MTIKRKDNPRTVLDDDERLMAIALKANADDVEAGFDAVDAALAAKASTAAVGASLAAKADKVGDADIEITSSHAGLILQSPDETRYRLGVSDLGVLTVTAIP